MLSPFSSALAKLDDSLQTIQTLLQSPRGNLDADGDQLRRSLADVCHYATILSELVSSQRSTTNEIDHAPLDQLVYELTILRRTHRRRLKLLNLATELSSGRVHHHRVNRTQALNKLRLQAIRELWGVATRSSEHKDLPGPRSSKWLSWACGLQEETDAATLQVLRQDFPVLEEFVAAMDERYWESSDSHATEFSSAIAEGTDEESADPQARSGFEKPDAAPHIDHDHLARNLLANFERVLHQGGAEEPSAAQNQSLAAPPVPERVEPESADKWVAPPQTADRPLVQQRGRLDKERIDKAAGVEFMKVVNAWQLDDSQARRLLGISRTLFNQLREGERVLLEPDKLTKISLLVAIFKGLNVLYGSRRGEKWVHRPNSNPLFNGNEPLKYMLKEGVEGLIKVRELVGVWSGYVSPEETQ